ncbi:MAG: hypothetical protein GX803_04570 [Lentisphaerae bacterium]|nr:hypothetical protein [Lentisphaerota bacterium]
MNQAPRTKQEWLKEHYEKILLLVALLALLISGVWLAARIQDCKEDAYHAMARISWRGNRIPLSDTLEFDTVLSEARANAVAPLRVADHSMVSEVRVACVKCGYPIGYNATNCPFCLSEQPPIIDIKSLDTDGDGIPDSVELELGLDPQNPADAHEDLDGDGFTNLEEFLAGTDPRDPQSMPDPVVKLRVARIRPIPFVLRYVGTQHLPDGSLRFLLNLQSLERSYFAKLGDVVLGYKVEQHDPAGRQGETLTMVRQADKRPVVLVKGRPVTQQELAIMFVSLLDKRPLPVQRLNDVFNYRGTEYKIVDIRPDSVVIQGVKSGTNVTISQISTEERAALTPPAGAAAPATPAPTDSPW